MSTKYLIAITGGIGAGKSIVSEILRIKGFPVYDCDSRAKFLMDNDSNIKRLLQESIGENTVDENGNINRNAVSKIVFADKIKLDTLNQIVHGAVRQDIENWCNKTPSDILFIETAILYQSGLDKMVNQVWEVTASENTRIERVCLRNNFSREEVIRRIQSQQFTPERLHPYIISIVNEKHTALLPQINDLIQDLKNRRLLY